MKIQMQNEIDLNECDTFSKRTWIDLKSFHLRETENDISDDEP